VQIHQLELFLAVLDTSSVTQAAGKMSLTPGAVSMQLHKLADELGAELFVMSGKRLSPTPAALHLAERAKDVIRDVRLIEHEFANEPFKDGRPFHFATGATTLIHRLGKPLRLLRKQYRNTEIRVTVASTEEMVAGVLDRRFDLGLISLPFSDQGLRILPLFDEEMLGLRPSPHRFRSSVIATVEPSELAKAPFLLYPARSNRRSIIDRFFQEIGVSPRVVLEADDTEAIKRLVESGFGYSILPQFALRGPMQFCETFRVAGHRMVRHQALAMAQTAYPRALTESIAGFLRAALVPTAGQAGAPSGSRSR
jgi:DNA-binding transcriptional LysR family regulator